MYRYYNYIHDGIFWVYEVYIPVAIFFFTCLEWKYSMFLSVSTHQRLCQLPVSRLFSKKPCEQEKKDNTPGKHVTTEKQNKKMPSFLKINP